MEVDYILHLKTFYLKPESYQEKVTTELTLKTDARLEDLDSLIFIEANGENTNSFQTNMSHVIL